jgi:transcriptional regulator with XRE-family HTH domain
MTRTKLTRIRKERGFGSAVQLGEALGLSTMGVHHWEVGTSTPRPKNAKRLEAVLQTPISTLLSPENAIAPPAEAKGAIKSAKTHKTRNESNRRVLTS